MQKLIWRNSLNEEINLTSFPFGITEWEGFSNASLNIQSQKVPFQDGGVFLDALIGERELNITLAMNDSNNLETRYELRRRLISILNPKLGEGYLIYENDFISKRIKCVPQIPLFENHNSNDPGTPKASLSWTACEPYWEDLEETSVMLKSGIKKEIINNGDVECSVKVDFDCTMVEEFSIQNLTNDVLIQCKPDIYIGKININTACGHKSISNKKLSCDVFFNNTNLLRTQVYTDNKKIYLYGTRFTGIVVDSKDIKYFDRTTSVSGVTAYLKPLNAFVICKTSDQTFWKSTDLINFEEMNLNFDGTVSQILYCDSLKLFYVITSTKVYTSEDFEIWEELSSNDKNFTDLIFANNIKRFVGVANNSLYVSLDYGETWGVVSLPESISYQSITNICYSETLQMFIFADSYINKTLFFYSYDGITWQSYEISSAYNPLKIRFINEYAKFYIASSTGIYSSVDGLSWILENSSITARDIIYIPGSCGFFIFNTNYIAFGEPVENLKISRYFYNIIGVAKNDDIYIASGRDYKIYKSVAGSEWVLKYSENKSSNNCGCAYNNGIFVTGYNGYILYSIDDGETWTKEYFGSNYQFFDLFYDEKLGNFVLCTENGVYISENAIGWTRVLNHNIYKIIHCESLNAYIGVGENGVYFGSEISSMIIVSENISNCTDIAEDGNGNIIIICSYYDNNQNLLRGIYYSKNGKNWSLSNISLNQNHTYAIVFLTKNRYFVLTSSTGNVYISKDGVNWDQLLSSSYSNYYYYNNFIDYNGNELLTGYSNILKFDLTDEINLISKITPQSSLNLNLKVNKNEILLNNVEGSISFARITYRQKYIGV